jgi:hypothetical protein
MGGTGGVGGVLCIERPERIWEWVSRTASVLAVVLLKCFLGEDPTLYYYIVAEWYC